MSNYRIEDRLKAMGYDPSTLEENDKIAIATDLNYLHEEYIEEIAENSWYVPGGVVNVYDDNYVPVASIIINEEIPKLNVDDTYTINATVKPDNASFKQLLYNSGDASIVTIDKKGKITSKAIGTTTITVISDDNEAITATTTVEVKIGVTSVTVSGAELVKTCTPQQLSVTVEPEEATYKEVTWSSSNEAIATVNETGLVTAVSAGNVTITATSTDNPSASGSHNMTAEVSVTGLTLDKNSLNIDLNDSTPQTITATVLPSDATDKSLSWSSSNENVATVNNGVVTGVGDGEATITVKSNDNDSKTDTCTITSKAIDYSQNYFTTVVTTGGDITWTGTTPDGSTTPNTLSYSTDGGTNWSTPSNNITLTVETDDKVLWKGETNPTSFGIGKFRGDTNVRYSVEGNTMSLLFGDNFKGQISLEGKDSAFNSLFAGNNNVVSAENLSLPATTLTDYSYANMFQECERLMTVPELPATKLTESCYAQMFYGCTSLTTAPELPATTLAENCYDSMFQGCTNLTTAPELPATTLANYCYLNMFDGCTSLTTAPALPATTLTGGCYASMFEGCTKLNSITCFATDISATNCTQNWVNGVAASGTFTVLSDMTSWTIGTNGIPSGWNKYVETKLVAKYNVTDASSPTILRTDYEDNIFKSMEIDGIILDELVTEYTFETTGKHIVKYELYDETKLGNENSVFESSNLIECIIPDGVTSIGNYAFEDCSSLASVTIGNGVTSISDGAFEYCSGLTSITIPDSVTSIGNEAFYGCRSLTSITIPNSVTSISSYAFSSCSSLTSVTIGNSVTTIGSRAFEYCSGLTSINVNSDNAVYDSRNNCNAIIETETNVLVFGCKSTVIPDSVTSIKNNAFYGCRSLTSITIPDSIISIGDGAFTSSGLTSITIPDSVTSIGNYVFQSCDSLINVIIGNNITSISSNIFSGCSGITSVTIGSGITHIDYSVFEDCKKLTSINVDSGNTVYDSRNNCNAIIETATNKLVFGCKTTIIPDSVTCIGNSAFQGCSGLTSITIPNSVTRIDQYVFKYCSGLTSITIPDSVTYIGFYAFDHCSSLTSITIPNSVTRIDSSFSCCSGLISMNVDTGNTVYDSRNNCNAIIETATNKLLFGCKTTIIPDSVTSIKNNAFYGCRSLTSITIPDSVTNIGQCAFTDCSGLTDVIIGNGVTSIERSAFYGCSGLTSVTCNATTAPTISNNTFQNINTGGTLTVPSGSTGYDNWMRYNNYYLGRYSWTKVEQ